MADTLLVDIGNTRVKWGVGSATGVRRTQALDHGAGIDALLAAFDALRARVPLAAMHGCSVGPADVQAAITAWLQQQRVPVHWVDVQREALGVRCGYDTLAHLGVDRWVAVLAAHRPICSHLVVDVGTATTLDAVRADGTHLGGMILPGLSLMQESLFANTERIERSAEQLADPRHAMEFFAADTDLAVQNGCLAALSGAVRYAFDALNRASPGAELRLTGGGAAAILRYMPKPCRHEPALILQGLNRLANAR